MTGEPKSYIVCENETSVANRSFKTAKSSNKLVIVWLTLYVHHVQIKQVPLIFLP